MADTKSPTPPRSATTTGSSHASGTNTQTTSIQNDIRSRLKHRQSSYQTLSPSLKPDLARRRSSILSFSSLEDATHSFTEDFLHPGGRRSTTMGREDEEVTHWHSSPLAFAILPAIGGLLFKNGSAFVTDVLLLGLAAVFMNWSIRLPWDWYYSAQAIRQDVEPDYDTALDEDDTLVELDETAVKTPASEASPLLPPQSRPSLNRKPTVQDIRTREEAAADLRKQELLALFGTFTFPALAAWLLHIIRAQLSRPSTGLVSDYNLSIFLLAAEIRPVRQLVRLVSGRTLHLQRLASGLSDTLTSPGYPQSSFAGGNSALESRLRDLEVRLAAQQQLPESASIAQKADVSDLSTEVRKRYEPRLEGLERAVRRYEKRSTTMAMLTEQRLQSLEQRLQDALSLAAVAAQSSQRRGVVGATFDAAAVVVVWPIKTAWSLILLPFSLLEDAYVKLKDAVLGPSAPRGKRASSRRDDRTRDRSATKKVVR